MEMLGLKEVDKQEKYLGLPAIIGRSKKAIFSGLKDRIWKKVQGWKENFLSRVGREFLIKSVIQAIPIYMMSIFRLPEGLINDIHSMFAKFGGVQAATNEKYTGTTGITCVFLRVWVVWVSAI